MRKTSLSALKSFITDDQILEVLIKYEKRKMEAAELLQSYMFDKWRITKLEAIDILKAVYKEFK